MPRLANRGTDTWFMGDGLTLLSPVQKGPIWRVRITWPSGTVHHFGEFASEEDAKNWITAHPWLAERQAEPSPADFRAPPRYRRGGGVDPPPPLFTFSRGPPPPPQKPNLTPPPFVLPPPNHPPPPPPPPP